jgi:phage-related protein (TIGR01555 family)
MAGTVNGTPEVIDLARAIELAALRGARADGFVQSETGIGDRSRDRSKAYHYDPEAYDFGGMREEWRGDPLIAAFVEKPPKAMFRRGFEVSTLSRDLDDYVRTRLDELQIVVAIRKAAEYSRAYRGGGVFLRFDDADENSPQRLAMPVRHGARLIGAEAYDEKELWAQVPYWERNPLSRDFGKPTLWRWTPYVSLGQLLWVHPSRLLILSGPVVSNNDRFAHAGWGNSRGHRVLQPTADFYASCRSILLSLQSSDLFAMGMENYTQLMARSDGEDLIRMYIRNLSRARSNAGALLYDSKLEKPERLSASMQGIADGLKAAEETLAAAYQMPLGEIFGTEPPGLNADGAVNDERYNKAIGDEQRDLTPQILQVARFLVAEKDPGYTGSLSIKWTPLREQTESEQEDVRGKVAQRDQLYIAARVITPEEVRQSRFGGERYSSETKLDRDGDGDVDQADEAVTQAVPAAIAPADPTLAAGLDAAAQAERRAA